MNPQLTEKLLWLVASVALLAANIVSLFNQLKAK